MHIVELIPTLSVGGAERVVALLALSLVRAGHTVEVIVLGAPSGTWIEAQLLEAGIPVHFLGKGAGLDPRIIVRLARLLRRLRPAVVHSHLHVLKYALPALRLARHRCAVVHTLHNLAAHEATPPDQRLQRLAFRRGVCPVAIGTAVAESVPPLYGRPPGATIPNGIPVDDYRAPAAARAEVRAELGLDAEAPVFLAVGRLNPQKNHALLLEAFAQVHAQNPQARLLIAGEGDLRPALEAQRAALGLPEAAARLLGVRGDVPRLLAAADVFVLSSTWEGNPLSVMEAMAAGRAIVSTAVGCVPELVPAEAGRLVPSEDAAALAEALAALAAQPALAQRLGAEGGAVARRRFDVAVMSQAYVDLFAALCARSG